MNKSNERVLKEWMLDEIHFDAGGKGLLWSREEIDKLACYIAGPSQTERFHAGKGMRGMLSYVQPAGITTRVDWESAKEIREALAGAGWSGIVSARWLAGYSSFPQIYAAIMKHSKEAQAIKRRRDRARRRGPEPRRKKRYFPSHLRVSKPWIDWNEAEDNEDKIQKSGILDKNTDNSFKGMTDDQIEHVVERQDLALRHIAQADKHEKRKRHP